MKFRNRKTVFVALSGGVDSSVAALLLKKKNYNVVGVFMRNWSEDIGQGSCTYKEDELSARLVAQQLNIPFYVFNFEKEYRKKVVDYLIKGYKNGITPNPDVMCNKFIKFGYFFEKALEAGADFIATGHYARIAYQIKKNKKIKNKEFKLLKAKDEFKDQTYFLYSLNQKILSKTLFPIGDYLKKEVREIARENKLFNANKKDSQGICFIGKVSMRDFLKKYIKITPGEIINTKGKKLGAHIGLSFYTIGQREGLAIATGGGPYYVAKKDFQRNALIVVNNRNDPLLYDNNLVVKDINWISGRQPKFPFNCYIRIRHQGDLIKGKILQFENQKNSVIIKFEKPLWAPAQGQAAVFYKGTNVIGGGIINK